MTIDILNRTFDERDEFSRKAIAEKAITLFVSDVDVSPMVIDGGWGTGKTEFCHKLINLMKQEESPAIPVTFTKLQECQYLQRSMNLMISHCF